MRAVTDFLLREALTLLLDDPTPRNVAQAMGGTYAQEALALESQTDASQESESQGLAAVTTSSHRVMMVRATNSAQQLVTLVDRHFSIDAFIPQAMINELRVTRRYQSISRLRGSVVKIVKYHFVTPAQCRATHLKSRQPASVSTRNARRDKARLWLFVDGLAVVDDSELAVNPLPDLEEHPAVAKQLDALNPTALEQRLALRQVLEVGALSSPVEPPQIPQPPTKRFDNHNPLRDEDVEIPEDQEHALEAQDDWPEPDQRVEPTDSQLIAENGPVSGSGESQPTSSGNEIISSSSNTVVSSSSEAMSPEGRPRVVVPETEPQTTSQEQVQPSAPDDGSVPDSQDGHFQKVNLKKTFVECSDTESENEEFEDEGNMTAPKPSQQLPEANTQASAEVAPSVQSSAATESQSIPSSGEASQKPLTQAPEVSSESTSAEAMLSQPAGEFVGVVHPDHDNPMTQMGDESQAIGEDALSSVEWHTQAPGPTPSLEIPSDQETIDVEYEMGNHDEQDLGTNDEDLGDRPSVSQQDGQADHWMNTEPTNASPAKPTRRNASPGQQGSPGDGLNVTQRRKRRRSSAGTTDTQLFSPQEPSAKATRGSVGPATTSTAPRTAVSDANAFVSFVAGSDTPSSASLAMGISAFNKKMTNPQLQRLRPSKRYQHLLPPFDFDAIRRMINDKHE